MAINRREFLILSFISLDTVLSCKALAAGEKPRPLPADNPAENPQENQIDRIAQALTNQFFENPELFLFTGATSILTVLGVKEFLRFINNSRR